MTADGRRRVPTRILGSGGWRASLARDPEPDWESAPVVRKVDVAVVGGGPSGLVAAYRLRHDDVLLLEAETEVGGNAREGRWHGTPWPMGAIVTYARSPVMALYDELELEPLPTDSSYGRRTFLGDRCAERPLWKGGLETLLGADLASGVRRAGDELRELGAGDELREPGAGDGVAELDRRPLASLLEAHGPEVTAFFDRLLGWFGGTTRSYSAHVGALLARSQMGEGLGLLYPEDTSEGGPRTFPGGLGRATRELARAIGRSGDDRLWTGCPVYRVEPGSESVTVRAVRDGEPVAVRAGAVVVAVPKPVAARIVSGLPADQRSAMDSFRYVPFLVVGLATRREIAPGVPVARTLDGPFATFRRVADEDGRVLYRCEVPLELEAGEHRLDPASLGERAARIVAHLERLFPGAEAEIEELRVWRRGRNWYVPVPGMVSGFQPRAREPVGRVSFAHADSLGPVSEFGWAMLAADRAVEHARSVLAERHPA